MAQSTIPSSSANDFSSLRIGDLIAQLQSSASGLTDKEASIRLKEQQRSVKFESRFAGDLRLLIRQFTNPLVLLLVAAASLAAILGESPDAYIILFILLVTGLLGFWQEWKAGRAFEKLKRMIGMKHSIVRSGKTVQLPAQEIVPGDMILLDAGDIIPADCRIIESNELHVNESSLTGESYPVEKSAGDIKKNCRLAEKYNSLWQGTNVISGTATVIAVKTGMDTEFGKMAHSLVRSPETVFEKGIRRFGFFLLRITVILALTIFAINIYFHKPLFDSLLFSLALAVGMAPELLPAIMTFAMSASSRRMMKKKVIVKKLSSIFSFGEVNLLCTDKTGTITEGSVKVNAIVNDNGNTDERIAHYAFLNASLQNGFANPVDESIKMLAPAIDGYRKINEVPYDFMRKRLSVAVEIKQSKLILTKGAFDNMLAICSYLENESGQPYLIDAKKRNELSERFIAYSKQGYRVLGLSYKQLIAEKMSREDECAMTFLGYILLEDPLKENVPHSLERLRQLGIGIKIITGDNRYAARHAAEHIGMEKISVLTGDEIDALSPEALVVKAKETNIFAETEPHQKERIIRSLRKSHFTVAYIGDGINDVAAINEADIGISTSNAVDVAKDAADFVLLEKDLSVLADGVYEGRRSFTNSMKYIFINTGATFGNMFSVAGASLFLPFLPMLPKQILLTNLLTDLPYLTIATDHVDDDQLSSPGYWNLAMIRNFMIVFGLHSSAFDFLTFYGLHNYLGLTGADFQTGWFLESAITELLILFIIRTPRSFTRSRPGKYLLISSMLSLAAVVYLPVSPLANVLGLSRLHANEAAFIAGVLIAYVVTADLLKIIFFRFYRKRQY